MYPDVKAFKDQITKVYALLLEACPSMKVRRDLLCILHELLIILP